MEKPKMQLDRFFLYIIGKILVALFAIGIAAFVFFTALCSMNVNITIKDGFAYRTSVILNPINNDDTQRLNKIFTEEYLKKSKLDTQQTNASYQISNYVEITNVSFAIIFPWQNKAIVQVKHSVDEIQATAGEASDSFHKVDEFIESGVYNVTMKKNEAGTWNIDDLELIEKITPENAYPIPTPKPTDATSENGTGESTPGESISPEMEE